MNNIKETTKLIYALSTNEEKAGAINEQFLELVSRMEEMYRDARKSIEDKDKEYCEAFELLITETDKQVKSYLKTIQKDFDGKVSEVNMLLSDLEDKMSGSETDIRSQITDAKAELKDFSKRVIEANKEQQSSAKESVSSLVKKSQENFSKIESKTEKINKEIDSLKEDLINKFSVVLASQNTGGGSMNRQILVGGTNPLTRYTDYNIIAGSGVTITYANDDVNKRVNLTFISSGGAGVAYETPVGAVDDSNTTFTVSHQPAYIIVNGAQYLVGTGTYVSYIAGTITLSSPVGVGGFIRSAY